MSEESQSHIPGNRDPHLLLDLAGRICEASTPAAVLLGSGAEEIRFRPVQEFFPSLGITRAIEAVSLVPEGSEIKLHAELQRKDGVRRPVRLKMSSRPTRREILVRMGHHGRAQDHLLEEAAFSQALLGSCEAPVIVLNGNDRIVLANRAFEELVGVPYSELRGKTLWTFMASQPEAEQAQTSVTRARSDGSIKRELWTWRSKTGERRPMACQISHFQMPGGTRSFVLARGVDLPIPELGQTEGRIACPDIGPALNRVRSILDSMPALVSYVDHDGKHVFGNLRFEDWFGIPLSRLAGNTLKDLLPPNLAAGVHPHLERALRGEAASFEMAVPGPGGGERFLQVTLTPDSVSPGNIRGVLVEAHDISSYRRVIQDFQGFQARLQAVLDQAPFAVALVDSEDRFLLVNRQYEDTVGIDRASVMGKSVRDVFPSVVAERITEENAAVRKTQAPSEVEETRITPVGLRTFLNIKFLIFNADRSIYAVGSLTKDITKRRRAEQETQWLNERMEDRVRGRTEELERALEDLRTFVYAMAHTLRAPLRSMAGFSNALKEDYSGKVLDVRGEDFLRRIAVSAKHMEALIQGLLDFGRVAAGKMTCRPLSLQGLVAGALGVLERELADRSANVDIASGLPSVVGDEEVLKLVLVHLLSNAFKFVAPGVAPAVTIWAEMHGGAVRLVIQDNGIGIPAEYHDRIFGLFEQLNLPEQYPGTGIGLAIVKKALDRLWGKVDFENAPGGGSRFWIEFPKALTHGAE